MHYEFTKQAIEAGKNIYVEKPFTLTVEHAEELKNLAQEKLVLFFHYVLLLPYYILI